MVTSKPTHFAAPIVAHFGLTDFFARVIGSELDLTNADKPTLVRLARALHPDEPDGAFVMIGDREHDIIGARANGLASIGVTYGARGGGGDRGGGADTHRRFGGGVGGIAALSRAHRWQAAWSLCLRAVSCAVQRNARMRTCLPGPPTCRAS